uniref:phenylalanine--tRNA ligase n=1 Tax=Vertebrata thuyoides TaxID=2006970 RepID=A0A1Z1MAU8_9FLOR|nr:Phenylalanine-tRNA ligase beta subunit [Vertebrata thuyoides]ARW63208.1 Phenylalanine-tRNA ligase beta subunit [Vertebrata thuyoides]
MKFSWQLVNNFLKIQEIKFKEIEDKLILSGIEIDNIIELNNDKILDLSITTNRKEINSALSLAREISIVTNLKMNLIPIKLNLTEETINQFNYTSYTHINYSRTHIIDEKINTRTPKWIVNQLQINEIEPKHTLEDIQKYIKIKWGQTFNIIKITNLDKLTLEYKLKDYQDTISSLINKNKFQKSRLQLISFQSDEQKIKKSFSNYDNNEFYENYYIDSIKIINTVYKNTTGKYKEIYKLLNFPIKEINLKQNTIHRWLGSTENKKTKFLGKSKTIEVLERLRFSPKYVKTKKLFTLQIPTYRSHDLQRDIDIIEEIGKIYEFKNFHSTYKKSIKKGNKSVNLLHMKNIRRTLRYLGFNETINCSLTINNYYKKDILKICNPINKEQKELRKNIIEGLIENYKYNIRYSDKNLFIFEIGKIFKRNKEKNCFLESKHLGGLIYTREYSRQNWLEKPQGIQILHVKGLIELFLEKINAEVKLKYLNNEVQSNSISPLLIQSNQIGIYNIKNNQIIGIIGELSHNNLSKNQKKSSRVYLFEINTEELINCIVQKNHLSYRHKEYSDYPSIVRDISLTLKKDEHVQKIQEELNNLNEPLIESIKIFNEYKTQNINQQRSIGVRITYRSFKKTLSSNDIKNVSVKIDKIIGEMM